MNKIKDKQVLRLNIVSSIKVGAVSILFNIRFSNFSSLSGMWYFSVKSMNGRIN